MCKKCIEIDEMIGKKFGKLTVLERVENNKNREKRYLCECECGNRKIITKNNLLHNHTKSCGRCKEPKPGNKFGLLTVIKKSDKKAKDGHCYFECLCECGNTTFVLSSHLRSGAIKSCSKCKDPRPGEKFGLLIVIKKSNKKDKHGNRYSECRCECGNTTTVINSKLRSGTIKSCGRCKESRPGEKFGLLTVIKKSDKKAKCGHYYFECRCECGNTILALSSNLKNGSTKSCGCLGSSSGEYYICNFLDANFIYYIREKKIEELITSNGGHPRFDFELFDKYGNSFFLEFHGRQHYWPINNSEFGAMQREETDPMKIKYCEENNESLHVINEFEDVDSSLTRILYYREMLTPKRLERNKPIYKIKRTLFVDKDGHLSIFSAREDIQAAA